MNWKLKQPVNWKLKERINEEFGSQVDFAQTIGLNETLVSKVVRGAGKWRDEYNSILKAKTLF